jgi:uncharacterized protein Yka (UPF0111/DUF47 family)
MAIRFFPKIIKFFELFKRQNAVLVESVVILDRVFSNITLAKELGKKIVDHEMQGNQLSRDISLSLAQTFITPIDREDIHAMNLAQERVLNSIRSVSTRIGLYRLSTIKPGARDLICMLKEMHEEISVMVGALEKKTTIEKNMIKVRQLKTEAEMLLLVSLGEIYESQPENSSGFLELVTWSHIYDRIEEAYAESEVLANIVEGISLKYA